MTGKTVVESKKNTLATDNIGNSNQLELDIIFVNLDSLIRERYSVRSFLAVVNIPVFSSSLRGFYLKILRPQIDFLLTKLYCGQNFKCYLEIN